MQDPDKVLEELKRHSLITGIVREQRSNGEPDAVKVASPVRKEGDLPYEEI